MSIWNLFTHSSWLWWALWASTFAAGALVHFWRIYVRGRPWLAHSWLEGLGLALWALGCMAGGMQAGDAPLVARDGLIPWVRASWTLGSVLLLCGAAMYVRRLWKGL